MINNYISDNNNANSTHNIIYEEDSNVILIENKKRKLGTQSNQNNSSDLSLQTLEAPSVSVAESLTSEPSVSNLVQPIGIRLSAYSTLLKVQILEAHNLLSDPEVSSEISIMYYTKSGSIPKDLSRSITVGVATPPWQMLFIRHRNEILIIEGYSIELRGFSRGEPHYLGTHEIFLENLQHKQKTLMNVKLSNGGEVDLVLTLFLSDKELE
eukprot:CAMPEP_0168562726 /NCGR_PEP_ID=MMETSP0413-20121227/12285_1 /TAXON_ID=136452 /ORGANISM="Filamoeba nolandi, Strain NC-AS-23-1" /LENGTH=210 /DNA_ID=CAMNT_0008594189 /DNA_START=1205 /DNA_END=1837 /DNA_ORIENTATION=+